MCGIGATLRMGSTGARGPRETDRPARPPPPMPPPLLLIQRGDLPKLAKTRFWPRALQLLSALPPETSADVAASRLPLEAVLALGGARLYCHAGSIILHRCRIALRRSSPH